MIDINAEAVKGRSRSVGSVNVQLVDAVVCRIGIVIRAERTSKTDVVTITIGSAFQNRRAPIPLSGLESVLIVVDAHVIAASAGHRRHAADLVDIDSVVAAVSMVLGNVVSATYNVSLPARGTSQIVDAGINDVHHSETVNGSGDDGAGPIRGIAAVSRSIGRNLHARSTR